MKVVNKVPVTSGSIPKFFLTNNGVHSLFVKNSIIETSLKNEMLSESNTYKIPTVVKIVTTADSFKINSINFSFFKLNLKSQTILIIINMV